MYLNRLRLLGRGVIPEFIKRRICRAPWTHNNKFTASVGSQSYNSSQERREPSKLSASVYPEVPCIVSNQEKQEFLATLPELLEDLREYCSFSDDDAATNRYIEMLKYNVAFGRLTPGLLLIAIYKMIQSPENLTPENIGLANILGWCTEMRKAVWNITDDIIDSSETRHGRAAWYKRKGVGLVAIRDALMLEQGVYYTLKKHFAEHPCYTSTLELYHYSNMKTGVGQTYDNMFLVNGKPQLDMYTMENYLTLSESKFTHCFFYSPFVFSMCLAGTFDREAYDEVETITRKLGAVMQVQDDFVDCFLSRSIDNESTAEIRDGKCTWLIVRALELATPAQRRILEKNYGRPDGECAAIVRALYDEMDLCSVYLNYWEKNYQRMRTYIQETCKKLPPESFLYVLDVISGRRL